jgi:hypothetical protein
MRGEAVPNRLHKSAKTYYVLKHKEGVLSMLKQKQRKIDATGKQYTDTVRVPDQAVAKKRGEQTQQNNGGLSQQFFNAAINQHQHQVKAAQQITQMPVATYMNFAESMFSITQASVGSYMKFANSMFYFSPARVRSTERATKEANRLAEEARRQVKEAEESRSEAERRAEEVEKSTNEAERSSSESESRADDDPPLADFDSLNVKQAAQRLEELGNTEVEQLRRYEEAHKNRSTLLRRMDERLGAS